MVIICFLWFLYSVCFRGKEVFRWKILVLLISGWLYGLFMLFNFV